MNLKLLRTSKKLTQAEMGKILNITGATYNGYETEKYEPTINTLCQLADYFNVSLDYLVGRNFKNEIGFLNDQQKTAVKMIQQLNNQNLALAIAYMGGMIVNQ